MPKALPDRFFFSQISSGGARSAGGRAPPLAAPILPDLHASEQYFTSSQTFSHALRQTISRPQAAQILRGKSPLRRILGMSKLHHHLPRIWGCFALRQGGGLAGRAARRWGGVAL